MLRIPDDLVCELLSAYVGRDQEMLDHVDLNLPINSVVISFGPFLKYIININEPVSIGNTMSIASTLNVPSAATVFVPPTTNARNKKDNLFNGIAALIESSSAGLYESELLQGKKLVVLLRDIFWHIDGHHHIFEQRAKKIPAIFCSFVNYNVPELSKHHKHVTRNISADQLGDFALDLSVLLQSSYWDRPHWCELKPHFTVLLQAILSYQEYLVQKNRKAKLYHVSPTPIRELSKFLHMKLIKTSDDGQHIISSLESIDDHFKSQDYYQCTCINAFYLLKVCLITV